MVPLVDKNVFILLKQWLVQAGKHGTFSGKESGMQHEKIFQSIRMHVFHQKMLNDKFIGAWL